MFHAVAGNQPVIMYNFVPTLRQELVQGKRLASPCFAMLVNRSSYKHTLFNFTTFKVYEKMTEPQIKIPKMHSMYIPRYLRTIKAQQEAMIDNGYRLYEKWPVQRAMYRITWMFTFILLLINLGRLYCFWLEYR